MKKRQHIPDLLNCFEQGLGYDNSIPVNKRILRNLDWLLNTHSTLNKENLEEFEYVSKSVLAYGIKEYMNMDDNEQCILKLADEIKQSILNFEPRIIPETLNVKALNQEEKENNIKYNRIVFLIQGFLQTTNKAEKLLIKTEVDLETGHCNLNETT